MISMQDSTMYPLQAIRRCVPVAETLIKKWKDVVERNGGSMWELEVRFGQNTETGFVPGTSFKFFNTALLWFESSTEWAKVDDWTEMHEFYYRVDRTVVRSTVSFTGEGAGVHTVHKIKKKHVRQNFYCNRDMSPASHRDFANWPDFRLELSSEQPVTVTLPDVVDTQLVRIKQRKSFHYRLSDEGGQSLWRYDFTRCWSGQTMAEAEQNQRSSSTVEPRYEIEIECTNPEALLKSGDLNYIAQSLLLKTNDFYRPSVKDVLSVHRSMSLVEYFLDVAQ